ncbi:methanol dehydrogenase [Vagococcus vulneris]|uniref:Methanol dehydrogenase n=1 Tax=Vagococcus vulneris TaxID=1977869 RepID=A0A429ZWI1_9ENTE|nr:methanol dehydrogenase [Vagococcus vulneris]RST98189.1 methanol dehydrogenase [Vagococcus vulneris]
MKSNLVKLGIGLGIMALGAAYVTRKTGFFEDDSHLYDEFESF